MLGEKTLDLTLVQWTASHILPHLCIALYCTATVGDFSRKKHRLPAWSLQNYVFIYTKILIEELEIVSLVLCVFVKLDTVPKDTSPAEQANADCWVSSLLEGRLDSVTAVQSLHYSSLEGMWYCLAACDCRE